MKKLLAGALLFLASFIFFLVASLPARFAVQYLPRNAPVQLQGIDGTIWHGSARQVIWQNQPLGQIEWRLHPLPLLLGRVSTDFELKGDGLAAKGKLIAYRDQSAEFYDTMINAELGQLPLPSNLMATPSGDISAEVRHARLEQRWPVALDADLTWHPARLLTPLELELGQATLKATGKDDKLSGDLTSSGALKVGGKLSLNRTGAFRADLRIAPTDSTPPELRDMLPMLGKPNSKGEISIRQSLQLRGFPQ